MKTFQKPSFFKATNKDQVYKVDYAQVANEAINYKVSANITNAITDKYKIALMIIDAQNTFCIPNFELFVAGAPDDNERLASFIYENLGHLTNIIPTMDTHESMQIFHPAFWLDENDNPVIPGKTMISSADLDKGLYKINPATAAALGHNYAALEKYARYYVQKLEEKGKYKLTVWPYHAMLTGIGHALTSMIEEAVYFHSFARNSKPDIRIKGGNTLTENYSVINPEITTYEHDGKVLPIADSKGGAFVDTLLKHDIVIIAGQAKSHCVAWTIEDLLQQIASKDPSLAKKVYLLEDCTSPVIIPGVVDFTADANAAFDRFAAAGMNIVHTTTPLDQWPGIDANKLLNK